MKLTHLLYAGLGGVANVVFLLEKQNYKKKYWKPSLILNGPKIYKDYKKFCNSHNIQFKYVKTKKYLPFFYWYKIFNNLCIYKPDIIMLHNFQVIPAVIYSFFFKKKIILVDHYSYGLKNFKDYFVGSLIKIFRHKVIVLNKDNYNYYTKKININNNDVQIIKNGIDLKNNNLKIKNSKVFKMGTASRVNSQKNISLVIKALKSQSLKKFNILYSIAGTGEDLKMLKKLVNNLKLGSKVEFVGFLSGKKLDKWYKKLNLYIQPSKGEASSTSILQAMSFSKIVLGSKVFGIKEMLNDKKNIGVLFSNNEKSLIKKIKYIIKLNKNSQYKIIKSQTNYIEKYHNLNKAFNLYKKFIDKE